jgi:uncharacterized protein (DUF1684 family)
MIKRILGLGVLLILSSSCKDEKRYHSEKEEVVVAADSSEFDFQADIKKFQAQLNEEYSNPATSPLYDRHRVHFEGLDYFEPDERFRVNAKLIVTPDTTPFMMPTTSDKVQNEERVYGILEFELFSKPFRLEVYQSTRLMEDPKYTDYLFLPFTDLTNSEETYGGGRYLDLRIPKTDQIVIDFNKAYNPYCAYNVKYACPKVPKVNHLDIAIEAGVKKFSP